MVLSKMLEVLIVRSNYSECLFCIEAFQYSFGNGTSDLRFCASSEFIDKDEAGRVAKPSHFHVSKVDRVGTQIIFNALFVADINKNMVENSGMTPFIHGNKQPALQHVP